MSGSNRNNGSPQTSRPAERGKDARNRLSANSSRHKSVSKRLSKGRPATSASSSTKSNSTSSYSGLLLVVVVIVVFGVIAYVVSLRRKLATTQDSNKPASGNPPAPTSWFDRIKSLFSKPKTSTSGLTSSPQSATNPVPNTASAPSRNVAATLATSATSATSANSPPVGQPNASAQNNWSGLDNFLGNRKRYTMYTDSDSESESDSDSDSETFSESVPLSSNNGAKENSGADHKVEENEDEQVPENVHSVEPTTTSGTTVVGNGREAVPGSVSESESEQVKPSLSNRTSTNKSVKFGQRTVSIVDENGNVNTTTEQIEEVRDHNKPAKVRRDSKTSRSNVSTNGQARAAQNVFPERNTEQRRTRVVDSMRFNIPLFGSYVVGIGLGQQVEAPQFGVSRSIAPPPPVSNLKIEVLDDEP